MIESDYLKDNKELIQKLRQIPTLKPLGEMDLHGALEVSKIRKYEPGELIFEEGSYDNWIYFLISGKVRIVKQEEQLAVLKRTGDVFGEMGIIDGSVRSASVYAVDETVCLAIHLDKQSGNDKFAFGYVLFRVFAEILAERLRLTSEELIKAREEISRLQGKEKQQES